MTADDMPNFTPYLAFEILFYRQSSYRISVTASSVLTQAGFRFATIRASQLIPARSRQRYEEDEVGLVFRRLSRLNGTQNMTLAGRD